MTEATLQLIAQLRELWDTCDRSSHKLVAESVELREQATAIYKHFTHSASSFQTRGAERQLRASGDDTGSSRSQNLLG